MDLTTATPREIDTELATIYGKINAAKYHRDNQWARVEHAVKRYLKMGYDRKPTSQQMRDTLAECVEFADVNGGYLVQDVVAAEAKYQELCEAVDELWMEAAPYGEEYDRRRWTRAFLVNNTNGHVHSSMNCSTCFPTTQYHWLPEYSGGTESQVVEDAGERACTVCYPSAPVEVLSRPTKIFSDDEKAAQKAREERAAAKVARDAKRLEKALLPSGEPLVVETWNNGRGYTSKEKFASLVSARTWLTDAHASHWEAGHACYPAKAVLTVAEAVAAKEGKSFEEVMAEAQKRAAKRK